MCGVRTFIKSTQFQESKSELYEYDFYINSVQSDLSLSLQKLQLVVEMLSYNSWDSGRGARDGVSYGEERAGGGWGWTRLTMVIRSGGSANISNWTFLTYQGEIL